MKCQKCGFFNPPAARFCNQCGAVIATAPVDRQKGQRRPVAVVFADLSGFTALSERMDPEEVKDLIDTCLKRLADRVYHYEGYIDKFIGDCIMAIFGAPVTHEDDPLRAVLSAMDMVREIKEINRTTKQSLALNVGINYGLVATGDLGREGAYTVMGDTVNLAQRLQAAASHGRIYVSQSVYEQTKNEIDYRRIGKIKVKGKKEAITVYVPHRILRQFSLRQIRESPFIGRRNELNRLKEKAQLVFAGQGQIVSIVGEAGIGKSKLVYELKQILAKGGFLIEGKGIEFLRTSSYYVLKEMLKEIFEIAGNETSVIAAKKVRQIVTRLDDPSLISAIPLFQYLLSIELTGDEYNRLESMKPDDRIRLINQSILNLFLKKAEKEPMVIIFDDCHWIDKESIDFMRRLAESIKNKPILLINIHRPEFETGNLSKLKFFTTIQLKPLPVSDSMALLQKIMNCRKIEDELLQLLLDKSGGLPFYIHELASNLLQNDMLAVKEGVAGLKVDKTFCIPRTLDELIMAKIDKLEAPLRGVVNIAAVIGDEFSLSLLEELLTQGAKLEEQIDTLGEAGIIVALIDKTSAKRIKEQYAFRHSIIRDAVYSSILKKELKKMHLEVAYAMEKVYAGNLFEYEDALANHFLQGENTNKAMEYLERAADSKKNLYLNEGALKLYRQMLDLVEPANANKKAQIHEKMGELYKLTGFYENALKSYAAMNSMGKSDPIITTRSFNAMAFVHVLQGKLDEALVLLMRGRNVLNRARDSAKPEIKIEQANILTLECWIYRIKGQIPDAEKKGLAAITMITEMGDWKEYEKLKKALADAYNNLAIVYCVKGDFEKAIDLCEDALLIAEEQGDRQGKGSIFNILGTVYRNQGQYDEAIEAFKMKLKISEELGDKKGVAIASSNLGNVYQNKDEPTRAYELFEKHLNICEELGDKTGVAMANCNLGIVYYVNCEYARALESFKNYLEISKALGDKRSTALALNNLGEVYESIFEYDRALISFRSSLKISEELGDKRIIAIVSNNLASSYTHKRKFSKAFYYLHSAEQYFESIHHKVAIGDIHNKIAYLRYLEDKLDDALEEAGRAHRLADESRAQEVKLAALNNMGLIYCQMSLEIRQKKDAVSIKQGKELFKKIVESYTLGLSIAQGLKNKRKQADILYQYGVVLGKLNHSHEARRFLNDAMKQYRELGIDKKIPQVTA